jgi:hypothetical protein
MRGLLPELERLKRLLPNPPPVLDEMIVLADECAAGTFVGD